MSGSGNDNRLLRPPRFSGVGDQDWQSLNEYLNEIYKELLRRRRAQATDTATDAATDKGCCDRPWTTLLGADITNPADWFEEREDVAPEASGAASPAWPIAFWTNTGDLSEAQQDPAEKDMGLWLDHTPFTGIPKGVWFFPPMRNGCAQLLNELQQVGQVGVTGLLPATWQLTIPPGMIVEVVQVQSAPSVILTENELVAIDIRFSGVFTTDQVVTMFLRVLSFGGENPAAPSSASVNLRLLAGSLAGLSNDGIRLQVTQEGFPTFYSERQAILDVPLVTQRLKASYVNASAIGDTWRRPALEFSFLANQPFDMTLRIGQPQIEELPYVSMQSRFGRTRTIRSIQLATLGMRYNPLRGTLIISASTIGAFNNGGLGEEYWFGLFTFSRATELDAGDPDNQMGVILNSAHTLIETRIIADGEVQPVSGVDLGITQGDPSLPPEENQATFRAAADRAAGKRGGSGFFREALSRDEAGKVSGGGDDESGDGLGDTDDGGQFPGNGDPFYIALAWEDGPEEGEMDIQLAAFGYVGRRVTIARPANFTTIILGQLLRFTDGEEVTGTSYLAGHMQNVDIRTEAIFDQDLAALTVSPTT